MADPADRPGYPFPLRGMLPRPVPFRYRLLDDEERAGRGRLAVRLWVLGYGPRTAWAFAMAEGTCWREHLPNLYRGRLADWDLPVAYMQRRLWEAAEREAGASARSADLSRAA
ncbi:hypothetical protein BH23CHL8_BH23CHL8_27360 [soil metagenome]